ncbi:FecCD family ABC transporter permease [Leadbettera azotonutricia]|uniref:Fe uptake system integral membrane protein n=1 Tax=Leadbettera azotonutricia (strain ATCC BAA-888 / DSM 13862 / ZAS-9) TaxID=545695 RepID=F5Y848_LEAAZ|nr:iron ABC transporter permease [Leadbettera azotonutricia]AEF80569.1 Fe uptake system integral membrane protein [Leadbettera azotonutricia ZAS-9]
MRPTKKILIGAIVALAILCAGTSLGSSGISFGDTLRVLLNKLLRLPLIAEVEPRNISIIWNLRFPRALLAFMVGGALSISGTVFQSVLKNQLASPYILGVSSGASLGAGLIMLSGLVIPVIGAFTLPAAGFVFGLATVFLVIGFASKLDKAMSNNTVILFGMVFSLFVNALLTTLTAMYREELKNLLHWQMGSFSMKGWSYVGLMFPFLILGTAGIIRYTREMDILTFGEDEARTMGVDAGGIRKRLLTFSAVLTGAAVALSGAIGFVDLIAPHLARKIVGSSHRHSLPMAFLTGGSLLVVTDLIARTVVTPSELPVGAVTAIIGAPFFAWVYFRKR